MNVSGRWWCGILALGAGCAGLASSRAAAPERLPVTSAVTYPAALQAAGVEGEVELDLPVDATGAPATSRVRVRKASHELFRSAVIDVVRGWRFTPARRGGRAVEDSVRVTWLFVLTTHDCPPPAYPHTECNVSTADTTAASAHQQTMVDARAAGTVIGTTTACAVSTRRVVCIGARSNS